MSIISCSKNLNYEVVKVSKKAILTIVPFMYRILTRHPDAQVNITPEDIALKNKKYRDKYTFGLDRLTNAVIGNKAYKI